MLDYIKSIVKINFACFFYFLKWFTMKFSVTHVEGLRIIFPMDSTGRDNGAGEVEELVLRTHNWRLKDPGMALCRSVVDNSIIFHLPEVSPLHYITWTFSLLKMTPESEPKSHW